jgi:hypothetical protein
MLQFLLIGTLWLSPSADDLAELRDAVDFLSYHLQLAEEEQDPYVLINGNSIEFYLEGVRLETIPVDAIERVFGPTVQLAGVDWIELPAPVYPLPLEDAYPAVDMESAAGLFRIHMSDGSEIVLVARSIQAGLEGFVQQGKRVPLDMQMPYFSDSSLTFVTIDDPQLHHFRRHLRPGMKILWVSAPKFPCPRLLLR